MEKTIVEKLNLEKYEKKAVLQKPEGEYLNGLQNYDTELTGSSYDLIFAFVLDMKALQALVGQVIEMQALNPGGYLYLAYPKKGNKVYSSFIHRDDLLKGLNADENGYIGNSSIKFARMVGLDDVFTVVGLKKEGKSKRSSSAKASQKVGDYEDRIADVEKDLREAPEQLAFFQSLSPGYRKDWARYIYSAKQEATKAKRREEMIEILGAGYKSRDLYRRR